jgi:hypothetical protein
MASGSILTQRILCQYASKSAVRKMEREPDQKEPVPLVSFPPIILALVKERRLLGSISACCGGEAVPEP